MTTSKLVEYTPRGLYCPQADIYIDPHKPVTRALITHGHSDHAILGHRYYLCTVLTAAIIKFRLGSFIQTQVIEWGEKTYINGVAFSFHPAGHIPGSAQICIEYKGEIIVITGDYKTEYDNISGRYELIACHTLITETTFALPIYQWKPQPYIMQEILDWYQSMMVNGKSAVLLAYALGKSQRIIQNIPLEIPVYTHATVEDTNQELRKAGLPLRNTIRINNRVSKKDIQKGITIITSAVVNTPWIHGLVDPVTAYASGWMAINRFKKQQSAHTGFVLSDHVDWNELNTVVQNCGAENIWLMHGYTDEYEKWLTAKGKNVKNIGSHFPTEIAAVDLLETD